MRWKVVGILGGMGPDSTVEFYRRFIEKTRAPRDQDHPHVIIDSNTQIPDRSAHIIRGETNPFDALVATGQNLARAGAELIAIPCNTSHHYFNELQQQVPVPLVNMVEATANRLKAITPAVRKVGVLATSGTVSSDIFGRLMAPIETLYPSAEEQESLVMASIYGPHGVKTLGPNDESAELLFEASRRLIERGADAIVTGCTEISLVVRHGDLEKPVIDSLDALVDETIQQASKEDN